MNIIITCASRACKVAVFKLVIIQAPAFLATSSLTVTGDASGDVWPTCAQDASWHLDSVHCAVTVAFIFVYKTLF